MIENLLIGLPYDRPGGLILSLIYFVGASGAAILLGFVYCYVCTSFRAVGWVLQVLSTIVRGVPLLLLVFLFAHIPNISTAMAGLSALILYSLTHTGEILRGFMSSYPEYMDAQARVIGLGHFSEWVTVRIPWVVSKSLPALLTHWISLLKDSGALIVISIGELTTVAKSLSESSAQFHVWASILLMTATIYFVTTLILIKVVNYVGNRFLFKGHAKYDQQIMASTTLT